MKNILVVLTSLALAVFSLSAQTSTNSIENVELAGVSRPYNSVELTLGAGGSVINGESVFGTDFTLSINPIKVRPEIWTGIAQGMYWEPRFAGSTDLYVDWSQDVWNDTIYLNVGWSGGAVYGDGYSTVWRTGPELSVQYYTHDNCFIFAGINYDIWVSGGDNEIRYSFGIGILF